MYVVTLANRKGGAGKSTIAAHLAVQAENADAGPVAVLDLDPQGSLADWWNEREAVTPAYADAQGKALNDVITELRSNGTKVLFLDTAGAIDAEGQAAIAAASLVIVPVKPSPNDLKAVGATIDTIEAHSKPMVFVVNSATKRATITGQAAVALSQHGTVAPSIIGHRTPYATAMIDGRTAQELDPNSPAALEIAELWNYVATRLAK